MPPSANLMMCQPPLTGHHLGPAGVRRQFVAAIRMGHEELDPGSDLEGGSVPRPVTAATRHPAHEAIDEPCRTWEAAAEYHDHPITKNTMAAIRTGTFA